MPTPADTPNPDTPCIACGYSLRGIADDAKCPECGMLAVKSRAERPLACVPTWLLRRIRAGMWVMTVGMILNAALYVTGGPMNLWWRLQDWVINPWRGTNATGMEFLGVQYGFMQITNLMSAIAGIMILRNVLPSAACWPRKRWSLALQRVMGICSWLYLPLVVLVVVEAIPFIVEWWTRTPLKLPVWPSWLSGNGRWGFVLLPVVVYAAACFRVRELAKRDGARRLALFAMVMLTLPSVVAIKSLMWWDGWHPGPISALPKVVLWSAHAFSIPFAAMLILTARLITRELRQRPRTKKMRSVKEGAGGSIGGGIG